MRLAEEEVVADRMADTETRTLELHIAAGSKALHERIRSLTDEARTARRKRLNQILGEVDQAWDELYELVALATDSIYTGADVRRWCERSVERRCAHPIFDSGTIRALIRYGRVPNEPFRIAYLNAIEKGCVQSELVATLDNIIGGYSGTQGVDTLRRQLGIQVQHGAWGRKLSFLMPYETAAALAGLLGLNPHDVGV